MTDPVKIHVDWNGNGTYASTDEVTSDVRTSHTVTLDQGVDSQRTLYPPMVGRAAFSLGSDPSNNNKYHPLSSTQLTVTPGLDTRICVIANGTTYEAFHGLLDDVNVNTDPQDESVRFILFDGLSIAVGRIISTVTYQGITTGAAIGHVLDAVGWPSARRKLDTGGTTMPTWSVDQTDAFSALTHLLELEGPQSRLFVDQEGDIVFHDRHRPFITDAAKTVQATFRNSGTEPVFLSGLRVDTRWRDLVNRVEYAIEPVTKQTEATLWTYPESSLIVNSGSTVKVYALAPSSAPFANVLTPEEDTDYTVAGSTIAPPSINQNSGSFIEITWVGSSGGNSRIEDLQLRGQPFSQGNELVVVDESTASQDTYGRVTTLSVSAGPSMDRNTALDLAAASVQDGKDPRAELTWTVSNLNSTRAVQQWSRSIGDRVRVIDARSGIDTEAWITRRVARIDDGGNYNTVVYTGRQVSTGLVGSTEVFILDSTDQGVLDTNKLGY